MAATLPSTNVSTGFLNLPVELRCQIYGYLYNDPQVITISAGYPTVFDSRIQDRRRRTEIPGLPLGLTPLARCEHNKRLLSVANPPTIPIDSAPMEDIESADLVYPAPMALSLSCRLVRDEMEDFLSRQKKIEQARPIAGKLRDNQDKNTEEDTEGLSLYVTYPCGVLVLKHMYPYLLKHAKRVHISGHYSSTPEPEPAPAFVPTMSMTGVNDHLTPSNSFVSAESFGTPAPLSNNSNSNSNSSNRALKRPAPAPEPARSHIRPRLRLDGPLPSMSRHTTQTTSFFPSFPPQTSALAPTALSHLIRTLLPPTPTHLTKLTARILYPGDNSYTAVWSDDASPVCHILRSICGGKIDMQVKRGSVATGVCLTARPKPESRIVSTSWENWRPGSGSGVGIEGRGYGRVLRRTGAGVVTDMDRFLMEV